MERAFLNQTAPLNKIKQVIDEEDERLKKVTLHQYYHFLPNVKWCFSSRLWSLLG